jgi:catechol 2,3-dioxygenase-like lactoylglutathione lyase family enzyme
LSPRILDSDDTIDAPSLADARPRPAPPRPQTPGPLAALAVILIGVSAAVTAEAGPPSGARAPMAGDAAPADRPAALIDAVGITVGDLDRSITFYRDVLSFSVVGEGEASGAALEQLTGIFGAHVRSARLTLGEQAIVLTEFLTPRGRPVPADGRSNDRAFQHAAIVVANMDRAHQVLREHHVRFVSTEPQTLPAWNKAAAGRRGRRQGAESGDVSRFPSSCCAERRLVAVPR